MSAASTASIDLNVAGGRRSGPVSKANLVPGRTCCQGELVGVEGRLLIAASLGGVRTGLAKRTMEANLAFDDR